MRMTRKEALAELWLATSGRIEESRMDAYERWVAIAEDLGVDAACALVTDLNDVQHAGMAAAVASGGGLEEAAQAPVAARVEDLDWGAAVTGGDEEDDFDGACAPAQLKRSSFMISASGLIEGRWSVWHPASRMPIHCHLSESFDRSDASDQTSDGLDELAIASSLHGIATTSKKACKQKQN